MNRMGTGWHNPYMGYHQAGSTATGTVIIPAGSAGGHIGYGYGYGGYGFGGGLGSAAGLGLRPGMGLGWGLSLLDVGPMLYNWGYSNYYNPYYGGGYGGWEYRRRAAAGRLRLFPADRSQSTPPEQTVANQAITTFDAAREAFKSW